jgi:hypothetical protein
MRNTALKNEFSSVEEIHYNNIVVTSQAVEMKIGIFFEKM